jgi:RES domain-containing protein
LKAQHATAEGRTTEQVFRHCLPEHTDLDATLAASREKDERGRFHLTGEFGAVYVACDPDSVLAELDYRAGLLGLTRAELLPRLMLTFELSVRRVLDLTDPAMRSAWGLSEENLAGDDYTRCREVARAARTDGIEAIRYPSARGRGINYAVFLDRLRPGSHLREESRDWIEGILPEP